MQPCLAQIVNVQPMLAREGQGLTGSTEGSVDWRTGTARLLLLSANGKLQFREGPHLVFALARGDFGRSAGTQIVRRHFEHLRYRVSLAGPLEGEVFVQYQEDAFRRLAIRALAGAGARVHFVRTAPLDASLGATPMFEYEQLGSGTQADAGLQRSRFRLSTSLVLAVFPSDRLRIQDTIYFQPRMDDVRDYRVLHELEAAASVTKKVSVKWSLTTLYDTRPPAGVVRLDASLKSGVQVSF